MGINILDSLTSSRIAAGEVIDRPASVLRELMDNASDASSSSVQVFIEEGGIKNITVIDDGSGMDKQDLEKCCLNHATSKIKTIDDIYTVRTMGFRGEALASIGACCRLEIETNGLSKTVDNGRESPVSVCSARKGTCIRCSDLFSMLPARRLFLKRPSSEAKECRKTFIEKALCFENINVSFTSDSVLSCQFRATDRVTRALDIMSLESGFDRASALVMNAESENVSIIAVSSSKECFKRDRTGIRIIINRRIIDNPAITHTVTNAFSAVLPGGAFPYFTLFIEDNPSLVDFNIHPAKRECRIRNNSELFALVTSTIRQSLLSVNIADAQQIRQDCQMPLIQQENQDEEQPLRKTDENSVSEKPERNYSFSKDSGDSCRPFIKTAPKFNPSWFENAKSILSKQEEKTNAEKNSAEKKPGIPQYRYIGQLFNTYIAAEKGDLILIIDQHAAHERILYDELKQNKDIQDLIVPYKFETDDDVDSFLVKNSFIYQEYGITLLRNAPTEWEITSVPAVCKSSEEKIASYIKQSCGDIEEVQKGLFAFIACHAAIKAGDMLDSITACSLIDKVLQMPQMVCPHGRSFVFTVTRSELDKKVGRVI